MFLCYEGEDTTAGGNKDDKLFTQAELDRHIATRLDRERTTWQKRNDELAGKLETIQNEHKLTEEQRTQLTEQIEQLRTEFLTKEEQAARTVKQQETAFRQQQEQSQAAIQTWQRRFQDATIEHDIISAAAAHEAFSTPQIAAILKPMTAVEEVQDDAGKGTGTFRAVVSFPDVDKDGNIVPKRLAVTDAVKRMKELPNYGNLFKANLAKGVGGNNQHNQPGGPPDVSKMTPDQYMELRKKNPAAIYGSK